MTKPQTLKGFRDFLPETMAVRNEMIRRLRQIFERYGFSELQTPALEYQEVLLGKYGEEAEKLMYLFKDPGGRKVGLRYDLTVPLARVVTAYPNLPVPFKRYQIQPAWRAENPQKGRYREFYQCDVDIVGSGSPLADAEILAVTSDAMKAFQFPSFTIRVNSRQVLFSIMERAGVAKNIWLSVIRSIDKLDKKPRSEVEEELQTKGLNSVQIKDVFAAIATAKPDDFLSLTLQYAQQLRASEQIQFDASLSRGLDYYDGPIFESVVKEPKIGSIAGGGRYNHLLKTIGGPDLPATGTTIGLDRAADVIEELNLWPKLPRSVTNVLVTIFQPQFLNESLAVTNSLRGEGINTELFPDTNAPLDKQLKYADKKGIPYVVIQGPSEIARNVVKLKTLATQTQEELTVDALVAKLKAK